jgi:predicted Kef-type K+ transport protein
VKRHRFDPFSLVFGAIFLSVGLAFMSGSTIGEGWHGVWPMAAVIVGVTLAAWAVTTAFGASRTERISDVDVPDEDATGASPSVDP